jgi:putative hydrolase of the HAD superfamily
MVYVNPPKALVLDFGGVVIKTPFETLEPLERRLRLAPGTLDWHGPFAPERDELWRAMQRDEITERDYWRLRAEEAGRAAGFPTPWTPLELVQEVFAGPESEFVRPEALEAMTAAHDAGIVVAVLTNDLAAFHGPGWFEKLSFAPLISVLVDASVTGRLKPRPEAYADLLAALGLSSGDVVFVDDQARNVAGADAVGIRALHFDVTQPAVSFDRALAAFGLPQPSTIAS